MERTDSKRVSKFDYGSFWICGELYVAVSKQRYTLEEAKVIAFEELKEYCVEESLFAYFDCWVVHRAGRNEDNEKVVGWWLEMEPRPSRSCPCWCFPASDEEYLYKVERKK